MRFTLSVNSKADYDSEDYFTTERTFNSEYLGDTIEHIENFLRSVGYSFGHLEVVNEDHLNPDMLRNMADED